LFVYWTIFCVLAVGAFLNRDGASRGGRPAFFVLISLPTALMIGLRWKIGPDWPGYMNIFSYTKLFSFDQAIGQSDPGFITLNWLLHQLGAPFWTVNMVCGVIFVAGLTAFSIRQPNPWLAFLVAFPYLVIVVAMSGDRQSVALGIMMFALNAFERRRLTWFVILILLAATFHGSIVLVLPICLLSYTRNGLQRTLLLLIAGLLAYYFFQEAFSTYARRYTSEVIQSSGVAYRLAMNSLAALLYLIIGPRFGLPPHEAKLWRNISLATLGLVILLAVFPSSTAIDRFLLYLFPLQFLVLSRLPQAVTADRQHTGQLTFAIVAYAALVQFIFLTFGTFSQYYIPYRSLFDA